jgi:hypothetical protein
MLPAAGGAILAVAQSEAVDQLRSGIAQLFGADSSVVAAAKDRIKGLRVQALGGSSAAVVALGYEAFEQRRGAPGDPRTPVDGKRSPEDARTLARRALNEYVAKFGALPEAAAQWATVLNAPVAAPRPSLVDSARTAITQGIEAGAQAAAAERINAAAAQALPWVVGVGVIVLVAWGVYRATK